MKHSKKIEDWKDKEDKLCQEMDDYENVYVHKNPCDEWEKNKWCKHYIKARGKKFRDRLQRSKIEILNTVSS